MGTGNYWRNGSCIFQSFMNCPLHSCRKLISSPFLFGIETNPWLILLLGEKRIWKWLFFFKKEITFLLPFYFFLQLEWNMGLRSLFFIISPKHYIWWQLVSWIRQPQLSFWVQTSVQHHLLHSRSRIWQSTANSALLLLPSFPRTHPDQGHCCPSTNRPEPGPHPSFFLWRFILSLGWLFASSCQAAPT